MSRSDELIQAYTANTHLIGRLTEGLSHVESLLAPPFPANCVNWVLGHIMVGRHRSLKLCEGSNLWPENLIRRYKSGSLPAVTGDDQIHHFDDLLKDLQKSQKRLEGHFRQLSDEYLEQDYHDEHGTRARWLCVRGLHWHETYHVGQLELLRSYILDKRG